MTENGVLNSSSSSALTPVILQCLGCVCSADAGSKSFWARLFPVEGARGESMRERGLGSLLRGRVGGLYRFRLVVIRSTWSEMLILKPTLSKGRGSGCSQIRQSHDEPGAQRQTERTGKDTAGSLSATLPRPAVLWGLISMPQKVTAGNLLNTTAICLPCSKGTNEKVYKLKSTWNFKDNTF